MKYIKQLFLLLPFFALFLSVAASPANASVVLDQSYTATPNLAVVLRDPSAGYLPIAQFFTPSLSGTIDHIDFKVGSFNLTPHSVTLHIQPLNSYGNPSGVDIASSTLSSISYPSIPNYSETTWLLSFPFSSSPAVTSGTKYALVLDSFIGDYAELDFDASSNTPRYNQGYAFYTFGWNYNPNYDLLFREYVIPINPVVGTITAQPNPVQVNNPTTVSAPFTDINTQDTHTASWNWGDGNTTSGTVTESNGSGSVSDSHTYTTAGVYVITLTVTDSEANTGIQTFQYLSVYNPTSQGLFSAGSKYTSPVGAYTQNTSLTGNVMFGLSYKYQGTVPVGNRQFSLDFKAANFTFDATTVSSLVISNGTGTLRGTGTINGAGNYNFLVTGNESTKTIRIQITNPSNNNSVIYDTQPGQADTASPTIPVTGNVLAH